MGYIYSCGDYKYRKFSQKCIIYTYLFEQNKAALLKDGFSI